MKAVVQRVKSASVTVDGKVISKIENGLLTLLGVARGDDETKLKKLVEKIAALRIFEDDQGKMNLSIKDKGGSHLIVSQFTLLGDTAKGARPSFINAESADVARAMYERALVLSQELGLPTFGGQFQAHMEVTLVNDGPVTILFDI